MFFEKYGLTCPIKFLTGVSCAGCGMTRAWLSFLRGDIAGAFSFHPLFWILIPTGLLFLFRNRLPKKFFSFAAAVIIAAFLIVYAHRMISPNDTIVVFDPSNGLIGRAVSFILRCCFSKQ